MVTGERHDTVMSVIMTNAAAAGTGCLCVCVLSGSVMSTENTYKYHMQVQENIASDSSLQQPHKTTLPLKQLLKPRAGHQHATALGNGAEHEALVNSDQTSDATASAGWMSIHVNSRFIYLFNGPLSGTTRLSRYQKGKTSLDFTEARDSDW